MTAIEDGKMTVRLDGRAQRTVVFDTAEFRQFDHGYAVTSHSSQGLTAGPGVGEHRHRFLAQLNQYRLAYVTLSRASDDARVYTNSAETLGKRFASDITKTAAVDFKQNRSGEEVLRIAHRATSSQFLYPQFRRLNWMGWRSPCSSNAVMQMVHSEWECSIWSFEHHAPIEFIQNGDLAPLELVVDALSAT